MDVTERPALEVRAYKPVGAPQQQTNKTTFMHSPVPTYLPWKYRGIQHAHPTLVCLSCYPMRHGLPNDAFRPSAFGSLPKQSELPAKEDGRGHQVIGSERRASGM